jgi:hypothetical protein
MGKLDVAQHDGGAANDITDTAYLKEVPQGQVDLSSSSTGNSIRRYMDNRIRDKRSHHTLWACRMEYKVPGVGELHHATVWKLVWIQCQMRLNQQLQSDMYLDTGASFHTPGLNCTMCTCLSTSA